MLVEENITLRTWSGRLLWWLVLPSAALLVIFRFLRAELVTERLRTLNKQVTNLGAEGAFPLLPPRVRGTRHLFGIERFPKVKRPSQEATTEAQPPNELEKVENLSS